MIPLRRFSSILFLFLMVLNISGYYSFMVMVKGQLTGRILEKIQSGVNEPGGNMIIKMPLSLPYSVDSKEYEPVRGQISYEGVIYQFVKQRLYKDTLYVVCVIDHQTTEANNKIKDYSKSLAGETREQSTGIRLVTSLTTYYFTNKHSLQSSDTGWTRDCLFAEVTDAYSYDSHPVIFHPPRSIA